MDQDAARKQLVAALVRVAGGDRAALQIVYRDTSAKLFGVCLRILRDQGEAEDVLQEVYLTVWRRAASFDPERASPITWLATIARNRAIDRLRAGGGRRMQPIDDAFEIGDDAPSAFDRLAGEDDYRRLMECLGELDPRHAGAVRTAFLDGATYDELARRLDVPLGTIKTWIRRSLLRLRGCLER
jgi:RNA polymerase sigma-70 factor (ECF subfamily)